MKPILKELTLMDGRAIDLLRAHNSPFKFTLQAVIGADGEIGDELFDITVCDSETYLGYVSLNNGSRPHAILEVKNLNPEEVYSAIEKLVSKVEGNTWSEIVDSLRKSMRWEFDEYRNYHKEDKAGR